MIYIEMYTYLSDLECSGKLNIYAVLVCGNSLHMSDLQAVS